MDTFRSYTTDKRLNKIGLLLSFLFISIVSQAQYGLSVEGKYVISYSTSSFELQGNEVSTSPFHGAEANLVHRLSKSDFPVSLSALTGVRFLRGNGMLEDIPFTVVTYRLNLGLGAHYQLNEKWSFQAHYALENNLDFEKFRTQAADLFRHSILLGTNYQFHDRWGATLSYQRALAPTTQHYFITNPMHQFKAGIIFRIL